MKNPMFRWFLMIAVPVFMLFSNSCKILNPNNMLYADKHYKYDTLGKDSTLATEYKLGPNDVIEFRLFANDGFKMIDVLPSAATANAIYRQGFDYPLNNEGIVRLPVIGNESLRGLTIEEAQTILETRYSEYYVKPFVMLRVVNRRVTIYTGEPGQAKVIPIVNNNTTVLEALALAGGISQNGKAYNIKLIRQTADPKKPVKIYKLDLSTIKNIEQGQTIVQSNDIIYVEPRRQIASKTLREVTPILSLITSTITFYLLISRL